MKTSRRKPLAAPAAGSEVADLRVRLAEAEETIRAIRNGEVDAVVVTGKQGDQVFTLDGAGHAYRVLIESMHEGALTLTADATILYANRYFAEIVQCPLEQVMGSSFRRFLSPEDLATFQPLLQRAGKSGTKLQVVLKAGDGSQLPAQISLSPLAEAGFKGATTGMVVTDMREAQRIAAQKETERLYTQVLEQAAELERRVDERTKQLLHANQELEAFESSVSHDLRGPLRHVVGFSDILIGVYAPQLPEAARGYLQKIRDGAGKMELLIAALLEFSRVSKQSLSLESVDVTRLWRGVLAEMRLDLGDRQIDVTIGDLPPCRADPLLLRQVVVNLLGNALKYSRTRDRSVIHISSLAQPDGGSAAYVIKDNGIGFDMKDAGKLFTVFERLHNARDFEGTGVGLTTVQRIIQRHGGRIWAESTPDAGATFFFTLGPPTSRAAA